MDVLAIAQVIEATLPTLGGEPLATARRDLATLKSAAWIAQRHGQGAPGALEEIDRIADAARVRSVDWQRSVETDVAARFGQTNLEVVSGVDASTFLLDAALDSLRADEVLLKFDDVVVAIPNDVIEIDGETLMMYDYDGETRLALRLDAIAALGIATRPWGVEILTLDGKRISLS